jgi:phenol 2-monooxygenase
VLVERCTTVTGFQVSEDTAETHPVIARIAHVKTDEDEFIKAKYLIGADGAASRVRDLMGMPFDGLATDCFWTIMDCEFKTDYPHILDFR